MITEESGWGPPGTIRHAEEIGRTWFAEHPPVDVLVAQSAAARKELGRAVDAMRDAVLYKPRSCGARGSGLVECVRVEHPLYEPHETWDGLTWYPGEAPR